MVTQKGNQNMKATLQVLCMAVFSLGASAQSIVFNAGDSFTYHFDTLTFRGVAPGTGLIGYLSLGTGSPFLTAEIGYELFEGQPEGTPVVSSTFLIPTAPIPPTAEPLWLDHEG